MPLDRVTLPLDELLDAAPDAIVVVDESGRIRAVNHLLEALFHYPAELLVDQPVEVLLPEESRGGHLGQRNGYLNEPVPRPMGGARRLVAQRRDGSRFPVHISLSPVHIDGETVVMAAIRDMTSWVEREREITSANRQRAIAEEHERLASDLHDTVIQELFAIGMSLQAVQSQAEPAFVADRIERAVDALDGTIRQIRQTIFSLRHGFDAGTLTQQLSALVSGMSPSLGFTPTLTFAGPLDTALPDEVIAHLVPTVREALTNVARHAVAEHAEVEVSLVDDVLSVVVVDDGVGIADERRPVSGLRNLERRALGLGGSMRIAREAPRGTRFEWTVPLPALVLSDDEITHS